MLQRYFVVLALVAGIVGTGCVSTSHVQTADTLGAGKFQFAMEPGVGGTAVISDAGGGSVYYPHVDLALRYGVTDTLDLGVRFGSSLVELQSKILLTSPDDADRAISLAPSVMGFFFASGGESVNYVNLALPVLIGFKTSGGSEFVLGPRLVGTNISTGASGESASINVLSVGASVGYALRVGRGFRLMPEIGLSIPVVGEVDTSQTDSEVLSGFAGGFVQFKLGFLFGQGRPIRSASSVEDTESGEAQDDSRPVEKDEEGYGSEY
jgi:hypothetical protein